MIPASFAWGAVAVLMLSGVGLVFWLCRKSEKNGALMQENKAQAEVLDADQKSDSVRDRFRRDRDYHDSVQKRFER
jgi:hypothetical protein